MKKKLLLRRKFATFAALLCLMTMMPLTAWAQNTVSTITTTETITRYSTVYVGEVIVDGETKIKYLYSGDLTISSVVIQNLLAGLEGMADNDYAAMLESFSFDSSQINGFAICSDPEIATTMDENWSNAQYVGTLYFPDKSIKSETNSNLYDIDESFKAAVDAKNEENRDGIDNLADVEKCIVSHLDTNTSTDVYYTIEDGQVVRHADATVTYLSEATIVIYTKVELESASTPTPRGDVNGDGEVNVTDVALTVNHILGNSNGSFNEAAADLNGDGEVNITDVVTLVDIILNGDDVPDLELSATTVLVTEESATVEIISGSGNYELSVSDPDVIDASLDGSKVIITSKMPGIMEVEVTQTTPANAPRKAPAVHQSTVTVKDMDTGQTADIKVTITEEESFLTCPDDNHPHMINLGLPSGTKWACCNVGATTPEEYGGYYAWGETEEKDYYSWDTYIHCDGSDNTCHNLGSDIAGTGYDVAHVQWGGSWVMPSHDQLVELLDNCSTQWMTKNGVNGRTFSGTNGGTIFLPAAGGRWDVGRYYVGSDGYYWSSTQNPLDSDNAYDLFFYSGRAYWGKYGSDRFYGYTVRPVSR